MKIKKEFFLLITLVLLINIISAEVLIGNKSSEISFPSGKSQQITGWINISLRDEPDNTLLTGPQNNITLRDLLDSNNVEYSCFPDDCESGYSAVGADADSKTINIPQGSSKLLGIKITGNVTSINADDLFSFNISTNAQESCFIPLKIDVLDDGSNEWKSEATSTDSYCFISQPYGCFDRKSIQTDLTAINFGSKYCERVNIPPVNAFKIGANVIGNRDAHFVLSITLSSEMECSDLYMNQSGEVSCIINSTESLSNFTQADVCIRLDPTYYPSDQNKIDYAENPYQMRYQSKNSSCGYIDNAGTYVQDFEIFAMPLKYASLSSFRFDKYSIGEQTMNELKTSIMNQITSKYKGNCNPQCLIPIRFYSGASQDMTLYSAKLEYRNTLGSKRNSSTINEINETRPLINMSFKKLDLAKANLITPSSYGIQNISIKLGDKELGNTTLNIRQGPEILAIVPSDNVPALISTSFFVVFAADSNVSTTNLTYSWNFGNSSEQMTTTNTITHTYSETGQFSLTVKVTNAYGAESIKTIKVNVIAPKDAINQTIKQYKQSLINITAQINSLPDWIKAQKIDKEKLIDVDDLKNQITSAEELYKDAFTSEEYLKAMNKLISIKMPRSLSISQSINTPFIPSETQIDYSLISELVGEVDDQYREKYFNAINNWARDSLNTSIESETYTLYYLSGEKEDLFSRIKINIQAKTTIDEFYLIVNENPAKVKFNGDFSEKDIGENAVYIKFSEFDSQKDIEFLYPKRVDALDMPIVILPPLKNLVVEGSLGVCNHDRTCDSSNGETWKNCKDDCKPWGWTLILLIILIVVAVIVYIGLQEWYKKYYESNLFLNRNQLFNLINYINNANNQGIQKKEIFDKLLALGWNKEQLEYAWNKYKGIRTGMWEIPVFKWVENNQVKKELEKRKTGPINKPNPNSIKK